MYPIIDEYFTLTKKFRRRYGGCTIVFIQQGNFYKVFANNLDDEQIRVCKNILHLRITKNDVSFASEFRCNMYKYYEKRILMNGYTVVYVDEVTKFFPFKRITWEVRDIRNFSDANEDRDCNFCTFIYAGCCPDLFATKSRTFY